MISSKEILIVDDSQDLTHLIADFLGMHGYQVHTAHDGYDALQCMDSKPIGIVVTAFLAIRLRLSRMPAGVGWLDLVGLGALAGIGFTVSIFIASLAFRQAGTTSAATLGILMASLAAGVLGMLILSLSRRAR